MDRPLVPFVAIATITSTGGQQKLEVESYYCAHRNCGDYLEFVDKKLKNAELNFMTYFEDDSTGNWFVKGIKGGIYILCTTIDYPRFIAVEVSSLLWS